MKSLRAIVLICATLVLIFVIVVLVASVSAAADQSSRALTVPKYDAASETTFKGTVIEMVDRQCPVSGGLGAHLNLKLEDGKTIEVHLAATKFVKNFGFVFNKGDKVEVVGVKVQFEDKEDDFCARSNARDGDLHFPRQGWRASLVKARQR